jgi:dihydrodipicolinate synthase/N-acetylneuraminate lyase
LQRYIDISITQKIEYAILVFQILYRFYFFVNKAAFAGGYQTAKKLHYKLLHLIDLLFVDGNPGGIKANLEILCICNSELRLPLAPVSEKTYEDLRIAAARRAED